MDSDDYPFGELLCSAKTSAGRNLHDSWCGFQPFSAVGPMNSVQRSRVVRRLVLSRFDSGAFSMRAYLRLRHLETTRMSASAVPTESFHGQSVPYERRRNEALIMIDVVDGAYGFLHTLFEESTGGQVLSLLAQVVP